MITEITRITELRKALPMRPGLSSFRHRAPQRSHLQEGWRSSPASGRRSKAGSLAWLSAKEALSEPRVGVSTRLCRVRNIQGGLTKFIPHFPADPHFHSDTETPRLLRRKTNIVLVFLCVAKKATRWSSGSAGAEHGTSMGKSGLVRFRDFEQVGFCFQVLENPGGNGKI